MLPEWDKISNRPISDDGTEPVYFAKIDCVANQDIYYSENIAVFPTLKFYFYGLPVEYDGENDYASMNEFINFLDYDNIDFDIETESEVDELKSKYLKTSDPVMIGFFDDSTRLSLYFTYACKVHRFLHCLSSERKELAEKYGAKMNSVLLIRQFAKEDEFSLYTGDSLIAAEDTLGGLMDWLNLHAYPKVIPFVEENRDMMFDRKRKGFSNHAIFVIDPTDEEQFKFIQRIATRYTGECLCLFIDANDTSDMVTGTLEQFGVDRARQPHAFIVSSKNEQVHVFKFVTELAFSEGNVGQWLADFTSGELGEGTKLNFGSDEEL